MAKKTQKPEAAHVVSEHDAEANAIMRLIDHAKKQGVSYFEGPRGIKFVFRKEAKRTSDRAQPQEVGDEWIP